MSHLAGREEDNDAERTVLPPGLAIVGLTYRFADPEIEHRFAAAMAPQGCGRLVILCWVALIVCLTRLAVPFTGLVAEPGFAHNVLPRCVTLSICMATLVLLRRFRTAQRLEILGGLFGAFYIATRCWLLPHMGTDGTAAMLVGTVALLVFGLPVRLAVLSPAMVLASVVMLVIWSAGTPRPSQVALLQTAEWLTVVNLLATVVLRMMRLTMRRQFALGQALRHLATHDGLTGIANRRHYDAVLAQHWDRCLEEARPLSLVLLDVDFFKLLNDGIGHAAGDACLCDLARLLVRCVDDPASLVARTGGEEFACVLPNTSPTDALAVAACITKALGKSAMPHPHSPIGPHITVSLGVATAYPAAGFALRDFAALADRLVYEAKADGRACMRQQVLGHSPARAARMQITSA